MTECGHGVLFGWHTCIKCGARDSDVIDELRAQNAALQAEMTNVMERSWADLRKQNAALVAAASELLAYEAANTHSFPLLPGTMGHAPLALWERLRAALASVKGAARE